MTFDADKRRQIFGRTEGRCHLCRKKLAWKNYATYGSKGAWEIEHSNPRSLGGTNRLNNLYPACISCNRSKGVSGTRTARQKYGYGAAPLSAEKRSENTWTGGALGALAGRMVLASYGPIGWLIGAAMGAAIGRMHEPD